jgi:hypothetical protein
MLEYLTETRSPRVGFNGLAEEHLDPSRPLFAAKTGLTGAKRDHLQLPADTYTTLRDALRAYRINLTVLNKMVNKLLEDEPKHGFGKMMAGFRVMFNEGELDKMRVSLSQCKTIAKNIPEMYTWSLREIHIDTGLSMGYTALAAVLGSADPTRGVPRKTPVMPTETSLVERATFHETAPVLLSATMRDLRHDLPSSPSPICQTHTNARICNT